MLPSPSLAEPDRLRVLRFAASFLWADHRVEPAERAFFVALAGELGCAADELPAVEDLLRQPPAPEDVDPARVPAALAATVRGVALRAIASDGQVEPREMEMWDLLDELLPRGDA